MSSRPEVTASPAVPSEAESVVSNNRALRAMWFILGWVNVGIGALGVVLPVLPTTPFFIAAAFCFSRSSRRFELWVLGLPAVGPMVRDYRSGLGVARRVKCIAVSMILAVGTVSAYVVSSKLWMSIMVAVLCLIGIGHIVLIIPLREKVLAERGLSTVDL